MDLHKTADALVALKQRQAAIRQRIVAGLAPSGKKLRRNAICPCGSGRKFKLCCLNGMKAKVEAVPYRNAKIDRMKPELLEPPTDENEPRTELEQSDGTPSPSGDA